MIRPAADQRAPVGEQAMLSKLIVRILHDDAIGRDSEARVQRP